MGLDDAFEQVDHAMDLSERLGFRRVELMQGFEVSVHGNTGVFRVGEDNGKTKCVMSLGIRQMVYSITAILIAKFIEI
jgi:hypothetical protein